MTQGHFAELSQLNRRGPALAAPLVLLRADVSHALAGSLTWENLLRFAYAPAANTSAISMDCS